MIGIRTPEEVNYLVAPQGHFFGNASAIPQGAKLGNIPDIPCVLRLVFDFLSALSARPGLVQRLLKTKNSNESLRREVHEEKYKLETIGSFVPFVASW